MTKERQISQPYDVEFSDRHRYGYGMNCPMMDLDWLCVEYDTYRPVLLVDYKRCLTARGPHLDGPYVSPYYRPMVMLADGCQIPALIVQYFPRYEYAMRVQALNEPARQALVVSSVLATRDMREVDYVAWLYEMRGYELSATSIRDHGNGWSEITLGRMWPPRWSDDQ